MASDGKLFDSAKEADQHDEFADARSELFKLFAELDNRMRKHDWDYDPGDAARFVVDNRMQFRDILNRMVG